MIQRRGWLDHWWLRCRVGVKCARFARRPAEANLVERSILWADGFSGSVLAESVARIMDSTRLLGLATSSIDGSPTVCNVYFAYDERFRIYFLTPPSSEHIKNIERDPRVAASVADTQQTGDGG